MYDISRLRVKRVQACIDAHGHHFQHLLLVHSDFPNALWNDEHYLHFYYTEISGQRPTASVLTPGKASFNGKLSAPHRRSMTCG
jgi:hypothetical protein